VKVGLNHCSVVSFLYIFIQVSEGVSGFFNSQIGWNTNATDHNYHRSSVPLFQQKAVSLNHKQEQ